MSETERFPIQKKNDAKRDSTKLLANWHPKKCEKIDILLQVDHHHPLVLKVPAFFSNQITYNIARIATPHSPSFKALSKEIKKNHAKMPLGPTCAISATEKRLSHNSTGKRQWRKIWSKVNKLNINNCTFAVFYRSMA